MILGLILYLWRIGRGSFELSRKGWNLIIGGFALLLLGSVLDITDNFESLSRFVVLGETQTQAVLEKLVGYLGGFLLIAIGLTQWIPTVQRLSDDLVERQRVERALRASESRVRVLLDSTAEAIYGLDLNGSCTLANPACALLLGYENPDQLLGKNMHALIHHTTVDGRPYEEAACRVYQAFRKGEKYHVDDELLWRADGTSFPAEYWSYPIHEDGKLIGAVVTFLDISQRKSAAEAQRAATRHAEQATATKSRFLAAASHDLRQPLQAAVLLTAALSHKVTDPKHLELLERQSAVFESMSRLLNGLLNVSKLEDAAHFEIVDVRVADMLDRMASQFADEAEAKGLDFRVVASSVLVRSSPVLLEGIVQNILANAIQHTDTGRVLVGCRRRGATLRIEVWDTGPGIPHDERQRIFEDFYQLGNPERNLNKGLGLGLSIVDRSARRLGHEIELRSEPGKGSMFAVVAPRCSPTTVPHSTGARTRRFGARRSHALITLVEDNPQVLDSTCVLLECEGYKDTM
jgi:PAS domain S-box-containing protein